MWKMKNANNANVTRKCCLLFFEVVRSPLLQIIRTEKHVIRSFLVAYGDIAKTLIIHHHHRKRLLVRYLPLKKTRLLTLFPFPHLRFILVEVPACRAI